MTSDAVADDASSWDLVEPCAGSAALTMHLLGATRQLVPYQGSKWSHRKSLHQVLLKHGFRGVPSRVTLCDAGPWGTALSALFCSLRRASVIGHLERLGEEDPRAVFDRLDNHPCPENVEQFTAEFLFLQRLAFSGKAVSGVPAGQRTMFGSSRHWGSPGFNRSSAYGLAATDVFGAINPMIPSLISALRKMSDTVVMPERGVLSFQMSARDLIVYRTGRRVVFFDPPYRGSTRYPDGHLAREEVVELAMRSCRDPDGRYLSDTLVMVAEAEPIDHLVAEGWEAFRIAGPKSTSEPFRSKKEEWVTVSPFLPVLRSSETSPLSLAQVV